ncbi:uncharacterized protein EV422DRAFT_396314 [Fimicolochytrium jonesii]|uniref:uncharacterized protein n=1 Tax=Fimicolochytrium jonesii TaxID=1396493 RepID=UPI0022FF022D|nr:uncharacterized protein EV422DRAFT_396314 [Fimicolochytrium jonesii]KAI8822379.1 hypothetical protein EV422DRAFT_396314 [Fimicolochytrium jonesii]
MKHWVFKASAVAALAGVTSSTKCANPATPIATGPKLGAYNTSATIPWATLQTFDSANPSVDFTLYNPGAPADAQGARFTRCAVDTGSTSLVLPARRLDRELYESSTEQGYMFYTSNDRLSIGKWMNQTIVFNTTSAIQLKGTVPVLAIARQCICHGWKLQEDGYDCPDSKRQGPWIERNRIGIYMMGVGFGSKSDPAGVFGWDKNTFLNVLPDDAHPGPFRKGWILDETGATLGLTELNTDRFLWAPLRRSYPDATLDWQRLEGVIKVNDLPELNSTSTLIDSGINTMILTAPADYAVPLNEEGNITLGTHINVKFGPRHAHIGEITYTIGSQAPYQPAKDTTIKPRIGVEGPGIGRVNTGIRAMKLYHLAFDAEEGFYGMRRRET